MAVQPAIPGLSSARLAEITAEPRRYGFHATLKPPMALRPGVGVSALIDALEAFSRKQSSFAIPGLSVAAIGRFLALIPITTPAALLSLAANCIKAFDPFRAFPTAAELAPRRGGLTDRQEALLQQWGYPYVMEEYRFHMTLTGPMEAPERDFVRTGLEERWGPVLAAPVAVDALTLFIQPTAPEPFAIVGRYPFLGPTG